MNFSGTSRPPELWRAKERVLSCDCFFGAGDENVTCLIWLRFKKNPAHPADPLVDAESRVLKPRVLFLSRQPPSGPVVSIP